MSACPPCSSPALEEHTLVLLVLVHFFLCQAEFLALANMQVDLVSDVRDNGGPLTSVRLLATEKMCPSH